MKKLTKLALYENSIEDLAPLAGLTQLECLELECNPISDLSPLSKFDQPLKLSLDEKQIELLKPHKVLPKNIEVIVC
jgi:internalin A